MEKIEIRKQAIVMYLAKHKPADICRELNRSRPWFYKWLSRYENNPQGNWFTEHSRRPLSIKNTISSDMEKLVIQIRHKLENTLYAQVGAISIQWELSKLNIKPLPVWTIDRIIKKHNLSHKKPKTSKRENDYPDYSRAYTHQIDIVGPRYLAKNRRKIYFLNIIDTHSHCVHINPVRNKASEGIVRSVVRFWQQFGIPDFLQMDNELAFRGSNRYPHSFGQLIHLILLHGVKPVFIPQAEPWRNGIIEKFNDTFDKKFFRTQTFNDFNDMAASIKDFETFHNLNYRYSANKNQTPMTVFNSDLSVCRLDKDFQIPERIGVVDGEVIIIRFIRSDRKLNIFGEIFLLKADLVYKYVQAVISVEAQMLKIFYDDRLEQEFPYYVPVDWM
jgi:putative transposase